MVKKAYWIAFYRSVKNADALAAYAKLAGPAIEAAGGRFLARGMPAKVCHGSGGRMVLQFCVARVRVSIVPRTGVVVPHVLHSPPPARAAA